MKSIKISSGVLALLSLVAFAVPASADPFQMLGSWLQRRGDTVKIPALPISGVPANTIVNQTTVSSPRKITIPTGAFARVAVTGGTATGS